MSRFEASEGRPERGYVSEGEFLPSDWGRAAQKLSMITLYLVRRVRKLLELPMVIGDLLWNEVQQRELVGAEC